MNEIVESATFKRWIRSLPDRSAIARINARLRKISLGFVGDIKPLGRSLLEIRLHHGPGYRIYVLHEELNIVVLCGGDKDSQKRDIEHAGRLAKEWRKT